MKSKSVPMAIAATMLALSTGQAQTPLLPKSSITVKETMSDVLAPKSKGRGCKMDHHLVTYTPSVVLGADAQHVSITWRFYAGIQTPRGKGIKLVSEKIIPPGTPSKVAPITADSSLWLCSCCRQGNKDKAKVLGWYAELVKGDQVIARDRSTSGGLEITDFVVKRQGAPKDAGAMLEWVSPDAPHATAKPEEPAPSYIVLASRKKLSDTSRMKVPSGRFLYVSNSPVLTAEDVESANANVSSVKKTGHVSLNLTPSGSDKLAGGTLSEDQILVVVNGGTIMADEVSRSTYSGDGKAMSCLIIRGRLSKYELQDLAETFRPRKRRH